MLSLPYSLTVSSSLQEEIRFLCCPEMLVSLMLCDRMDPHEAILIQGAQQYSAYTGYGIHLLIDYGIRDHHCMSRERV